MSDAWALLIPVTALVVIVLGGIAVMKLQKSLFGALGTRTSDTAPPASPFATFQQSPNESREDFVRRHWQRPGVVADGVTLVDLYDRIRALEERLAEAERRSGGTA
ncbi:hypothetical protein [Lentzea flaviverrucosa]|uniref:Uncharacterized protein n=1 Tax=Lentzea flaviverrucosa TaxID=200379 RepID=A0A1H9W9P1_9PSEU|nr:hypothetical protein [Lentzea flaviverrucosa]RDI22279.1 hypothetical protein DFR72_112147 [Lentzea flaviverrucosa]SES30489.1 hypothetical protein SAMN05216195_111159 [Lentzea flaviverrucosa]